MAGARVIATATKFVSENHHGVGEFGNLEIRQQGHIARGNADVFVDPQGYLILKC